MKAIILAMSLIGATAMANEINPEMTYTRIQTCQSWKYSIDAGGHVCSFTGSVNVVRASEIDVLIRRIERLEQELAELRVEN